MNNIKFVIINKSNTDWSNIEHIGIRDYYFRHYIERFNPVLPNIEFVSLEQYSQKPYIKYNGILILTQCNKLKTLKQHIANGWDDILLTSELNDEIFNRILSLPMLNLNISKYVHGDVPFWPCNNVRFNEKFTFVLCKLLNLKIVATGDKGKNTQIWLTKNTYLDFAYQIHTQIGKTVKKCYTSNVYFIKYKKVSLDDNIKGYEIILFQ